LLEEEVPERLPLIKNDKNSCVTNKWSALSCPKQHIENAYAAVAAKTSCLLAFVSSPKAPAKPIVKPPNISSRLAEFCM